MASLNFVYLELGWHPAVYVVPDVFESLYFQRSLIHGINDVGGFALVLAVFRVMKFLLDFPASGPVVHAILNIFRVCIGAGVCGVVRLEH